MMVFIVPYKSKCKNHRGQRFQYCQNANVELDNYTLSTLIHCIFYILTNLLTWNLSKSCKKLIKNFIEWHWYGHLLSSFFVSLYFTTIYLELTALSMQAIYHKCSSDIWALIKKEVYRGTETLYKVIKLPCCDNNSTPNQYPPVEPAV